MSENLENYGLQDSNRAKIGDWFDEHQVPFEIDAHQFSGETFLQIKSIKVYFAEHICDDFLIKITCENARRAEYLSRLLYKTTSQMCIEQVLIFKDLFLLRRRSFKC
jgi:hypothetical protein